MLDHNKTRPSCNGQGPARPSRRRRTDDAAAPSASAAPEPAATTTSADDTPSKADDPFLYYSSDKRRMEHLLGRALPGHPEPPVQRKKRISFELDPFYDLTTSFPELVGEWFEGQE